ncbi:MAG: hypothetical protein WBP61_00580 [Nocardioides sp.]
MSRSNPRRVVGSRNPTGRPRKIASQTHPVEEPAEVAPDPVPDDAAGPPPPPGEPPADPTEERPDDGGRGARRTTIALAVAIVVLLGIGIAEVSYLLRDETETVSAERPVVTGEVSHRAAVDAAARSTEEILSTSFEDYDEQAEQARATMTDAFAEDYQQTSDDIRERFIDQRTRLQVKAVGQSVVQASPEQVQALLFLDQYVEKREDGKPVTDFAQYRALVTVVRTDQGWLVSDIETQ